MKNSPGLAATGILLACLAAVSTPQAGAQATRPLPSAQVDCSADQLRALLGRSALMFGPAYDDRTAMLLWTYGPPGGFQGLAVLEPFENDGRQTGTEHHMAYLVVPDPVRLLRNPARPQLDSVLLTRDDLDSDLSLLEDAYAMAVVLDPTADHLKNEDPSTLLVIDNLTADEGGLATNSKPGRGLGSVLRPCTSALTAADIHVFSVLSHVVRGLAYSGRRTDAHPALLSKLAAIYRGESSVPAGEAVRTQYRIDLYPTGGPNGLTRVSLTLDVEIAADGALGAATLRLLPACTSAGQRGCTTATSDGKVEIVRPTLNDQRWSQPAAAVCWGAPENGCSTEATFSFEDVLRGTTWLRPG